MQTKVSLIKISPDLDTWPVHCMSVQSLAQYAYKVILKPRPRLIIYTYFANMYSYVVD